MKLNFIFQHYRKFIVLALLLSFSIVLGACKDRPEKWVQKAKVALEEENSELALHHYQIAFELSLQDDFFVSDRDDTFSFIVLSANKKWLLAIKKDDNNKSLYLLNLKSLKSWEHEIHFKSDYVYISPNGFYSMFMVKAEEQKTGSKCAILIWDRKSEEFSALPDKFDCFHKPAISDRGLILYMQAGKIGSYNLLTREKIYPYLSQFPDKPMAHLPARAAFSFSAKSVPFMTYGSAGYYKLYSLRNRNLNLLTRDGSYARIYFLPGKSNPGIITGGAGVRSITFFHESIKGTVLFKNSISKLQQLTFPSEKKMYYIENMRVFEKTDKVTPLPFWAKDIYSGYSDVTYILSPTSKILQVSTLLMKSFHAKSLSLFNKGWELQESR